MKYSNKKYKKQQIIDELLSHFIITEKKKNPDKLQNINDLSKMKNHVFCRNNA